jgi:hypothetical protein
MAVGRPGSSALSQSHAPMRPRPVRSLRGRGHLLRNEPSPVGTTYPGQPVPDREHLPTPRKAAVSYALRIRRVIHSPAPRSVEDAKGPLLKIPDRAESLRRRHETGTRTLDLRRMLSGVQPGLVARWRESQSPVMPRRARVDRQPAGAARRQHAAAGIGEAAVRWRRPSRSRVPSPPRRRLGRAASP